MNTPHLFLALALALAGLPCVRAVQPPDAGVFAVPLTRAQLDAGALAEWFADKETTVVLKQGPAELVWTQDSRIEYTGVKFGDTKEPGIRHLRVGFTNPVRCESVLVCGGGRLSILKEGVPYPGRLDDESQWQEVHRMGHDQAPEVGREDYAVWVLPPGTATRALRFSHLPLPTDKETAGWLGGVWLLSGRFVNIAPQAIALASKNDSKAALLNNESDDHRWQGWESVTRDQKDEAMKQPPVSEAQPEWVMLDWPKEVPLRGLCALWAGFSAAEAQVFTGGADVHPREAGPELWRTVAVNHHVDPLYPLSLGPSWFDFGATVTTRAVRLRITATSLNTHPHVKDKPLGGRNVWLGELMALRPLEKGADLASVLLPHESTESDPPIAIPFTLTKAGHVTLVIDDMQGHRIRNLIADAAYAAGDNTAWWDGLDDRGRDVDAARHGLYHVPGQLVPPGEYRVRGLVHGGFDVRYEFPVYTHNSPAWNTEDNSGGWLANHTPPQAALFVPADRSPLGRAMVYLGSYVSEGTHGLAWVDLDGKKLGGMVWVGGNWTGAPYLACDLGDRAVPDRAVFAGAVWPVDRKTNPVELELRLTAITRGGAKPLIKRTWNSLRAGDRGEDLVGDELAGIAAHNGVLVASLRRRGVLTFFRVDDPSVETEYKVADPRGIAFDSQGRLLVLAGKELHRHVLHGLPGVPAPDDGTVLVRNLEDSVGLAIGPDGALYVSDQGASHQVKKFAADGKFLGVIGRAGVPASGPYDPQHMNHPAGITVDERGRLWVAEHDELPKRVSIWKPDGQLDQAFYGPSEYGGGGRLDSADANKFFYHGMEFALDWKKGDFALQRVYFRPAAGDLGTPQSPHAIRGVPEQPIYANGHRYFTNCFNSNPTGGPAVAMLWIDDDEKKSVRPVAAIGEANDWPLLGTEPFHSRWPAGIKPPGDRGPNSASFIWTDKNGDGQISPDEVTFEPGACGGVAVMPEGSFTLTRLHGKDCVRLAPIGWDERGVPSYEFAKAQILATDVKPPASSGGNQALTHPDGWTFLMNGTGPYDSHSLCGVFRGEARWSYPDLWPGLHASHEAAIPEFNGEIIGTTRFLGNFIQAKGVGPVALVNGNMGPMYAFTADGLFVTQLFQDSRIGKPWSMPRAERGMILDEVTTHDENFWPSVTQVPDGRVYLVDGGRSSLIRVDGFKDIHRLKDRILTLGTFELTAAQAWQEEREAARQKSRGTGTLAVFIRQTAPKMDGTLDDWAAAEWAPIDQRGTRANFNSNSRPYDVRATLCIAGDRLYAAYRTGEPKLLRNSGELPNAPFKTGGALDLMLATDPAAHPGRTAPAAGDLRLLVTLVNGKPRATLYRAIVPGTPAADRVPFSSPWRTISLDRVEDVSSQIEFAADKEGNYVYSIPLTALGLNAAAGQTLQGDLGILRGDGTTTTARVYWNNKATAITADVPSEAELTPALWGKFRFGTQ